MKNEPDLFMSSVTHLAQAYVGKDFGGIYIDAWKVGSVRFENCHLRSSFKDGPIPEGFKKARWLM